MNQDAFKLVWDARVKTVADELKRGSGAGAVLVAIFDGPWMTGREPAIMGIAGDDGTDLFRVARELREVASILEKQAGKIGSGEAFVESFPKGKPVRQ